MPNGFGTSVFLYSDITGSYHSSHLVNAPSSCNETQHYYMFLSSVLQEMECTWCCPIFQCQVSFHKRFGRQRSAISKGAGSLETELNVKWINDRCTKSMSTLHRRSKSKLIYIWKKNIFCNYGMDLKW